TADSCLMAAPGNIVGDILPKNKKKNSKSILRISKISTLLLGIFAILLASVMENVLTLMLYAYAFMVSGLLVPVVVAIISKKPRSLPALASMIVGGSVSIGLIIINWQ